MPTAVVIGSTTATVSTIIDTPSRKQPRIMYSAVSATSSSYLPRPIARTASAAAFGTPAKSSAAVNAAAPAMISMISVVLRTAPVKASRNIGHDTEPPSAAMTIAPTTPITADSVGVANPP